MQKYLSIFHLSVVHSVKNYKSLVGLTIFLLTCLLIFFHIWKIAAAKTGAVQLHPDQLLWYIACNEWVLIALPDMQEAMEEDLQSGRLAYLLPRPVSYLFSCFFEGLGILSVNLVVLGIAAFSFIWLQMGFLPFSATTLLTILLLGFFAGCVGLIFHLLIGISAFWLNNVGPFHWVWEKLLFTLGGLMLPLTVYPEWLQKIAIFTPFPALLGERSALCFHFSLQQALQVAASLAMWASIGAVGLAILYRKGLRRVHTGG